jgi:hypothetical protein
MAITMGKSHPLVKVARWYEQRFGKAAYAHLYVPARMTPSRASSPVLGQPLLFPHASAHRDDA